MTKIATARLEPVPQPGPLDVTGREVDRFFDPHWRMRARLRAPGASGPLLGRTAAAAILARPTRATRRALQSLRRVLGARAIGGWRHLHRPRLRATRRGRVLRRLLATTATGRHRERQPAGTRKDREHPQPPRMVSPQSNHVRPICCSRFSEELPHGQPHKARARSTREPTSARPRSPRRRAVSMFG